MAEKIVYSKYSNDRIEKYCIATDIIERDGNIIVRKKALNNQANEHINKLLFSEKELITQFKQSRFEVNKIIDSSDGIVEFEFIHGKTFDCILDEYLENNDFGGLIKTMRNFFHEMETVAVERFSVNKEFQYYFGDVAISEGELSMPYGNIDLIFQNVIVDPDDKWHIIDYEWFLDCMLPIKYIKYRAILLYVYGLSKRNVLIERNIFGEFDISSEDRLVFEQMETNFQCAIKENHMQLGDFYRLMPAPSINVNCLLSEKESNMIEVYYDYGNDFTETDKLRFASFPIHIPIGENVKAVRIDPMSTQGCVCLKEMVDDQGSELSCMTSGERVEENIYYFKQEDPYFIINDIHKGCRFINVDMETNLSGQHIELYLNKEQKEKTNLQNEKSNLQNEKSNLQNEIEHLKQSNIELEQDKQRLGVENQDLQCRIQMLEQSIEKIYHSWSWKITKPLRSLFEVIYKGIHRFKFTALLYDGTRYLILNGVRSTYRRIKELYGTSKTVMTEADFMLTDDIVTEQRNTVFEYAPKISILVPLYNTPEKFLCEMIDSVVNQTYGNWELCLADGSDEQNKVVKKICRTYSKKDARIVYKHLDENRGISDNTNACIDMATGDYIGLFDHDDLLTQDALYEVVKRINEKDNVDVVYTDEDKYLYDSKNSSGKFVEPHFKSDFNIDLFRTNNYICHFFVVRKSIVDKVGGFRKEYDGSQDYDFIFRCVEQARCIEHISKILYHWRIHANSTAANPQSKMYCYEAGKHAIESHLQRKGIEAAVEMTEHLGFYRVKYPVRGEPLVSIIIPNKDEKKTLKKCIDSILKKTSYRNYEIVIVENNSETQEIFDYYNSLSAYDNIHVKCWEHEFNYSKINNYGVEYAKGDYILLLNNDVEIITENWIEEMLSNCQRDEVGITGAKLLYPDNTVQHCGVIMGLGGIAGHAFVGLDGNHPGYFGRAFIQQNLSAVTAACLMVSRKVFNEVGGLEESLKVAFNDVDFCLKVREAGYLIVMNPNVKLYHYESKSRGAEDTPEKQARFESEVNFMFKKWQVVLESGDPYYNRNLTLVKGDFSKKE